MFLRALAPTELRQRLENYHLAPSDRLDEAATLAKRQCLSFQEALIKANVISETNLAQLLADYWKLPFVSLHAQRIDADLVTAIPAVMARAQAVIAFKQDKRCVHVALADPANIEVIRALNKRFEKPIQFHVAPRGQILEALGAAGQDHFKKRSVAGLTLKDLGFSAADIAKLRLVLKRPHGLILVAGPTGSGKTATVQALTRLRQDPDTIMVGEINDTQTAGATINAALTGHVVLSTIEANDAATAVLRLIDMKVPRTLLASSVNAVIGQRLVRRICRRCIHPVEIGKSEIAAAAKLLPALKQHRIQRTYQGHGCKACQHSGYAGRVGLFELMIMDEKLRQLIIDGKSPRSGLLQQGLEKVSAGVTTLEEVIRVFA